MSPRHSITRRELVIASVALGTAAELRPLASVLGDERPDPLDISWADNFLTIRGRFPGNEITILYLEAYCRPGSTNRDWGQTVIPHGGTCARRSR